MDDIDRRILAVIQEDFPLTPDPWERVAKTAMADSPDVLTLTGDEVRRRVARMQKGGVIRRIGAVLNPRSLGIVTMLVAAKVPEDRIDEFAQTVNENPRVTHNYQRPGPYTVWFTLWGKSRGEIEETVDEIGRRTGIDEISLFPAVKTYKIRAVFDVKSKKGDASTGDSS
ncbi:MAG: AsnC family transcriptional regulator [Deltaproteobacteria bacterium]|nr:AsnC family transcriptional regulator [Candidatus Zymogenaceae bacterium]